MYIPLSSSSPPHSHSSSPTNGSDAENGPCVFFLFLQAEKRKTESHTDWPTRSNPLPRRLYKSPHPLTDTEDSESRSLAGKARTSLFHFLLFPCYVITTQALLCIVSCERSHLAHVDNKTNTLKRRILLPVQFRFLLNASHDVELSEATCLRQPE